MPTEFPAILGGQPVNPEGPPSWPLRDSAVADALARAMNDGSWGRYVGRHCERLCDRIAAMHGVKHVHLCSSGTAAVELALRGLGVGPGDEVALAGYDFEANFKNILALGATPVLIDIRATDAQIDVELIDAAASEQTKVLLVSHLHGGTVNMPLVRAIADQHGWSIVEDACQMPGSTICGRKAGTWGDVGVLSFGGSKLLSAGRGGCLFTDRDDVLQRIRLHTWRGNDLSPLSELQAAVLLPQLNRLDALNAQRSANVLRLRQALEADSTLNMIQTPDALSPTSPGYYKVAFWYEPDEFGGLTRDAFAAAMRAEGIALWPGFRGLHRIHSSKRFRSNGDLPNADSADERLLVLHHPVLLGTNEQLEQIAVAASKVRSHAVKIREAEPTLSIAAFGERHAD